jgi:hypothetical protein
VDGELGTSPKGGPGAGLFVYHGNVRVRRMARGVLRQHVVRDRSLVVGDLFVAKRSFGARQSRWWCFRITRGEPKVSSLARSVTRPLSSPLAPRSKAGPSLV